MPDLDRPLLIWDGDCEFCRTWIARWRHETAGRVDYAAYQFVADRFPSIPLERFRQSVVLIEPGGRVSVAAEAVFRSLAHAPHGRVALAAYERLPGVAPVSEWAYRLIAGHRDAAGMLTQRLWGAHVVPPGERLTAWLFTRMLSLVYLAAFASLGVQILGLVGSHGILPIGPYLDAVTRAAGPMRVFVFPTLCWWNASDASLVLQCAAGATAAIVCLAGLAPGAMLALMWLLYLSLTTGGQEFLWFQWDSLLLEAGFLAMMLAPWTLRSTPGRDPPPSRAVLWMLRWLLFRVMFCSAAVKLSSGDATWWNATALRYHFETQPLPPWTAWYAHHLPAHILQASTIATLVIEGLVPFLAFLPRRPRRFGAFTLMGFQGLIIATGNYGFFNLLVLALCVLLLDDAGWPTALTRWSRAGTRAAPAPRGRRAVGWTTAALFALSIVPLAGSFRAPLPWLRPLVFVDRAVSPFRLVNSYGLFAVMTTRRSEIEIEGSDDLAEWKRYAFRWKPGDVSRRPEFVMPHMPRLDWQMWFAALDTGRPQPWTVGLCRRLLEGSPDVLRLFASDPFPDHPPRYVRALVYDVHFTSPAERRERGAWWVRTLAGEYLPPLTLEGDRLVPVTRSGP